jgi:uncharacterized protein YbbK (DUF523 family)
VEIGLEVPRDPVKIVKSSDSLRLIQPATELYLTDKSNRFSQRFLDSLPRSGWIHIEEQMSEQHHGRRENLLQHRKDIAYGEVAGFFGDIVVDRFRHLAVEDKRHMSNLQIKEQFLTRLYTLEDG